MKTYRGRRLRKVSRVITIAYLTSAISFGASCVAFSADRAIVKNDFKEGKISHSRYQAKCAQMQQREENVLKVIAAAFGVTFVADVATLAVGEQRE